MPDKASVFISYSHRDATFAERLRAAFEGAGRETWRDEDNIRPTAKWSGEIAKAIDGTDAVVFVLSPEFAASVECVKEIEHAVGRHKRLVPVVAAAVEPREVHAALAELQWISFTDGTAFDAAFGKLAEAIDADLPWIDEHTRYVERAVEWDAAGRPASLVLRGKQLGRAEQWLAQGDTKEPQPSLLQTQYIAAGRRAATRRQRIVAGALGTGLAVAVVLAVFAIVQRYAAEAARDDALHRLYTLELTRAEDLVDSDPSRAVDMLDDALRTSAALREFTSDLYRRLGNRTLLAVGGMRNPTDTTSEQATPVIALSHDGRLLAGSSVRRAKRWQYSDRRFITEIFVWDTVTGARVAVLPLLEDRSLGDMRVEAISFAPDGRHIAASAGSYRSVIKVWDLETGEVSMAAQSQYVEFLSLSSRAASPGGAEILGPLVAVGYFGSIEVWDEVRPDAVARTFDGRVVGNVAWPADGPGPIIASPNEIASWDITAGERAARSNPVGILEYTVVSPAGNRVAQISYDAIAVWRADAVDWHIEWLLKGAHAETITTLAFSPDGRRLASGGNDNTVKLWDLERGIPTLTLRGPADDVTAISFSADGARLAAGGGDASVFVWDIAGPPERPAERLEIDDRPTCLAFSADRSIALAGTPDTVVLRTGAGTHELGATTETERRRCGLSANGATLYYVEGDSTVVLQSTADTTQSVRLGPVTDVDAVRLAPRGDVVVAPASPDTLGLWDARSGTPLGTITAGGKLRRPLEFIDATLLVGHVAANDQTRLALWDIRSRAQLASLTAPDEQPQAFAHCAARRLFATASYEKLRIADFEAGAWLPERQWYERGLFAPLRGATALAFSPDCATLLIGDDHGKFSAWDTRTGARRFTVAAHTGPVVTRTSSGNGFGIRTKYTTDGVTALAVSPDGATIASGSGNGRGRGEARLWGADRGERYADLPVDGGAVTGIAFSADGSTLGIALEGPANEDAGAAATLDVWRTRNRDELRLIAAHAAPVTRLVFSPDGDELMSVDADGERKLWNPRTGAYVRALGRRPIGTNWTSTEPPDETVAFGADGHVRVEIQSEVIALYRDDAYVPTILRSEDEEHYFHSQPVRSLHALKDGTLISVAGTFLDEDRAAEIVLWDLDAERPRLEAYERSNGVTRLVLSPDERWFVTIGTVGPAADHPGFVHLWETATLRHVRSLVGHRTRVTAAAFSPDGRRLATGDVEGFVRIWDLSETTAPPGP